jgi:hypothetical protein
MSDDQPRWGLQITGRDSDLQGMRRAFKEDFDPYVEDTEKGLVLWSKQWQSCSTPQEAWEDASSLLRVINSIMLQTRRTQPVNADALIEKCKDGTLRRTIFAVIASSTTSSMTSIGRGQVFDSEGKLVPPPPPEPSMQQKWLQLAVNDEGLFDLLNYSLQRNSWFEAYKAIEVLENVAGGERPLVEKWGNDVKVLKWNANYFHRHAKGKFAPPARKMSLQEANDLLTKVINGVFDERL